MSDDGREKGLGQPAIDELVDGSGILIEMCGDGRRAGYPFGVDGEFEEPAPLGCPILGRDVLDGLFGKWAGHVVTVRLYSSHLPDGSLPG